MKIAYAGGGSGGHLTPLLSIVGAIETLSPGSEALFFVTEQGVERGVVERAGLKHEFVTAARMARGHYLKFPFALLSGIWQARRAIKSFSPDLILGGGGFVTVPVMLAAKLCNVPSVLLEQNTVPGRSNRLLARFARFVVTSFANTEGFAPSVSLRHLGNPLRFSRNDFPVKQGDDFHLVVTGGGQGARVINFAVAKAYEGLLKGGVSRITHACGARDFNSLKELASPFGDKVDLRAYVDDMGPVLASASLVISRAGATTLAELVELGIPSLLIPIPTSVYDHQRKNAAVLVDAGGAKLIEQVDLCSERLVTIVSDLLNQTKTLDTMKDGLEDLRRPRAAEDIARVLQSELLRR